MKRIPAAVLAVAAMVASASAAWSQEGEKERKIREEAMKERIEALEKKQSEGITWTAKDGPNCRSATWFRLLPSGGRGNWSRDSSAGIARC